MEAKGDLAYKVALEVLPKFEVADFSGLKVVNREIAEIPKKDVDEALERMAGQNRAFAPKAEGAAAETGDRVMVDFVGRSTGEAFEGGTGDGHLASISAPTPSFRASRISSSA